MECWCDDVIHLPAFDTARIEKQYSIQYGPEVPERWIMWGGGDAREWNDLMADDLFLMGRPIKR